MVGVLETYLGCSFTSGVCCKAGPLFKAHDSSKDISRKTTHLYIIIRHGAIEIIPRNLDPVFSAFKLCLQVTESIVGTQGWVVFAHHQQTT